LSPSDSIIPPILTKSVLCVLSRFKSLWALCRHFGSPSAFHARVGSGNRINTGSKWAFHSDSPDWQSLGKGSSRYPIPAVSNTAVVWDAASTLQIPVSFCYTQRRVSSPLNWQQPMICLPEQSLCLARQRRNRHCRRLRTIGGWYSCTPSLTDAS